MKILYIVNNAAFFHSHRLPIALAVRERGDEVELVTGAAGSPTLEVPAVASLTELGLPHRLARFRSGGTSLRGEAIGLFDLGRYVRRSKPNLVHCASPKGVLYGGLVARLTSVPALVLSISGMGSLFAETRGWRRALQRPYLALLRLVCSHPCCHVVVQNADDRDLLLRNRLARAAQITLIPGSGVDMDLLCRLPMEGREPLVVLPARLMADKGVLEFVEAARRLRGRGWRFALVGTADYDNPTIISAQRIAQWVDEGIVEWWGHRTTMHDVFGRARIVCLPSYREGMPKSLLEAAAAGCAVVTTDTVGCREAILPGHTGDLVPVRDPVALAETLGRLMADAERIRRYGEAGRALARERFDVRAVIARTLNIYDVLLAKSACAPPPAKREQAEAVSTGARHE